jgi:hypothetical protein
MPPGRRCEFAERDRRPVGRRSRVASTGSPMRRRERSAVGLFDLKVAGDRLPDTSTRLVAISRRRPGRYP